jgi:hypothetical protein
MYVLFPKTPLRVFFIAFLRRVCCEQKKHI